MSGSIREFAAASIGALADQTAFHMAHLVKSGDEESVHRLRVSIRRFQQALRLFPQFLDDRQAVKIKLQARALLKAAAEVRNRDISIALFAREGGQPALLARLESERNEKVRELRALARHSSRGAGRWRSRLGIEV